jgi:hypothetical protein
MVDPNDAMDEFMVDACRGIVMTPGRPRAPPPALRPATALQVRPWSLVVSGFMIADTHT